MRVICILPPKCLLSWSHADLVTLSSAFPIITGRSCLSLKPNCLLVELGAVIWPSLPAAIPPTKCVWANLTWPVFRTQNSPPRDQLSECEPRHRTDVAKLTFDLYKNNPKDFIGCLNVKATLYGVYSVSYDLRCYAAKNMLKWVKESAKYLEPSDIFML